MAPILKEADVPLTTATTTASPSAPAAKSPGEAPARPQPVPLEIPVTVNGARTVEGSDKREPFAETTQTVLVFPHGAVIRIATQLAPGQLVFLTNEKTKKEVVCQVVKSKSGGAANGYVELQFTEPAPAFWGLRLPGTAAPPPASAPAVPRPVVPPPAPKVVPPAASVAKIPAPLPVAPPVAQIPAPPKPVVVPPPPPAPPVIQPAPLASPQNAAPVAPASTVAVTPPLASPPALPKLPEPAPVDTVVPAETKHSAPLVTAPPPSPLSSAPAFTAPKPLIPPPTAGPHDYSKEIASLFAVPQAPEPAPSQPAVPAVPAPPPVSSSPSTEELKQQAARLQEQLSAMLFTEAPAKETKAAAPPAELKLDTPVEEVANKLLEIAHEEPKPITESALKMEAAPAAKTEIKPEPKPPAPARTPIFSSFNAKEQEVEIPAWLRPLSQNSEVIAEKPAAVESMETASSDPETGTLQESAVMDSSARSEAAVFGSQLLSGDSAAEPATTSSSKKGLVFGLVAAVVLVAAGGAWYYRQGHTVATPSTSTSQASSVLAVSEPVVATPAPIAAASPSRPAANSPAPSNSASPAPARTPVAAPPSAVPVEPRRNVETRNSAPVEEPAKKPSLGEVRLAAPVVRGSGEGHASESLPSIDAPAASAGADALDAMAHHKAPAVPLPVGGDVKTAQLIKSVPPVYPPMAKTQRITGNVTLDALIDTNGNVAQLKVISGPPLLHQAAVDAVKQWKYSPAQLDGNPTAMHLTVTVQFRAQ